MKGVTEMKAEEKIELLVKVLEAKKETLSGLVDGKKDEYHLAWLYQWGGSRYDTLLVAIG